MPADFIKTNIAYTKNISGGAGVKDILLVGKANQSTTGYGEVVEVRSLSAAETEFGSDESNSAELVNMVKAVFRQSNPPARVFCIANGKWTDSATTAVTSVSSSLGDSSFTVATDVTADFPIGTIIKVTQADKQDQFFRVKTSVFTTTTAITVEDYEQNGIALDAGATITAIDTTAANHADTASYTTALSNALTAPLTKGGRVRFAVIDSWLKEDIAELTAHVIEASTEEKQRIGAFGMAQYSGDKNAIIALTSDVSISHPYVVGVATYAMLDEEGFLMSGAEYTSNMIAGIAGETDVARPVQGIEITGTSGLLKEFKTSDLLEIRGGGCTVLYTDSFGLTVIENGVTTNTDSTLPVDIAISNLSIEVNDTIVSSIEGKHKREKATNTALTKIKNTVQLDVQNFIDIEVIDARKGREPSISLSFDDIDPRKLNILVGYYPVYGLKRIDLTTSVTLL